MSEIIPSTLSPKWPAVPIRDVIQPDVLVWSAHENPDEQRQYIEIADVNASTKTIARTRTIEGRTAPSRARNVVHTGDVLVSTTRPNLNAVALVPQTLDGQVCSTGFAVLRPNDRVTSSWLYWFVRSPGFVRAISSMVDGAMYPAVSDKEVSSISIPLPSVPEQERVSERLDEQMATLASAQATLAAQREATTALRTAVLRTALDPATHRDWRHVNLGSVSKVAGGSTPDSGNLTYWNGDIVWVTPVDLGRLTGHHISDSERHITRAGFGSASIEMIPANSVVMSSRAPIGHLAITDVPVTTNQGCKSFTPNPDLDASFLYYSLRVHVPDLQAIGSGATFAEISKSKLERYVIEVPSLPEQRRIAEYLDSSTKQIDALSTSLDEQAATLDALRTSLLDAIFGG